MLATAIGAASAFADPQRAPGITRLSDPRILLLPAQVEVFEIATTWFGVLKTGSSTPGRVIWPALETPSRAISRNARTRTITSWSSAQLADLER